MKDTEYAGLFTDDDKLAESEEDIDYSKALRQGAYEIKNARTPEEIRKAAKRYVALYEQALKNDDFNPTTSQTAIYNVYNNKTQAA